MAREEVLYDDEKIRIGYYGNSTDEHFLAIDSHWIVLQRGVLEELARTPPIDLKQKLNTVDNMADFLLNQARLSYEIVGCALAQARIVELEDELRGAYSQIKHY